MSIFSMEFKLPPLKIKNFLNVFKKRITFYSIENLPNNIYIRPRTHNSLSFLLRPSNAPPIAAIFFEIINASPINIILKQLTFDLLVEDNWIFIGKNKLIEKEIKAGSLIELPIPCDLTNSQIEKIKQIKTTNTYRKLGKARFNIEVIFLAKNKSFKKETKLEGIDYEII